MMAEQARHSTSPRTLARPLGDGALLDRAYAHCEAVIAEHGKTKPRIVIKRKGETWIEGLRMGGDFADEDD